MNITKPKPFCFVLMPFSSDFDDVYQLGIKDACDIAGTYCERVDEQMFDGLILDRVYNQIAKADIVVADMSRKNPNVFYEVGYAHALGKKTILITKNVDDIPFDLKHYPHIIYNESIVTLKEQLSKKIEWGLHTKEATFNQKLQIEIFCEGENLSTEGVIIDGRKGDELFELPNLELNLTFHNSSNITFYAGDFKVGIIDGSGFIGAYKQYEHVDLPDTRLMVMLPDFDTLYPLSYASKKIRLNYSFPVNVERKINIRLFSEIGTRDFFVTARFS